jgi:hypothetical protein
MARASFIVGQALQRIVPPPIQPYPISRPVTVGQPKRANLDACRHFYPEQFWPLRIKLASESEYWQIPVEPLITLSGENTIIRRSVAKSGTLADTRGTVKERWSQDDYRIQINGLLYNQSDDNVYPREDVGKLRYYCEAREGIDVECELFEIFGITRIVIEDYGIPFTKGENRQEYNITAYSDDSLKLLIDVEENV